MKYFKILILFITMGMLQACPGEGDGIVIEQLKIRNTSQKTIYLFEFLSNYEIEIGEVNYNTIRQLKIGYGQEIEYPFYEGNFNNGKKFYLFIFEQSILDDYTWEEIQELELYARYSFTLEELQAMNWEIVYTGE